MKNGFIAIGLSLCLLHHWVIPLSFQVQLIILLTGFVLLGIPHGAADILVARYQSESSRSRFSLLSFLLSYLLQIGIAGLLLWLLPITALLLFLSISAYHFGETDLKHLSTETWLGKLLITSYGLLILFFLLLTHMDEVQPIIAMVSDNWEWRPVLSAIAHYQQLLLGIIFIGFLVICFLYFQASPSASEVESGNFLLRLALIIIILYELPLLLGFSFYFVIWHSSLSMQSIICYLKKSNNYRPQQLFGHMALCSSIALAGTAIFILSWGDINGKNQLLWYCFAALALLTAPHMLVMRTMYKRLRGDRNQDLAKVY